MTAAGTGPLSYGQLSVWRDIEHLPAASRHQANLVYQIPLAEHAVPVPQVAAAVDLLRERHESLRTVFDLSRTEHPVQHVRPATQEPPPLSSVTPEPGEAPADTAQRVATRLAGQAFDLAVDEPLRVVVVEVQGRAQHVVLCLHHIAVDIWAVELLREEFGTLLTGGPRPAGITSPRELALAQHSGRWAARRAATRDYLHRVYSEVAADPTPEPPLCPKTVAKANLRSRVAGPAARARAEAAGISVPALVLAAYCWQGHELTGARRILVNAMTTNRLFPGTATLVTSMNQWARVISERVPGQDFAQFAARLHWNVLRAYRHGCYDVDVDEAVRREVEAGTGPVAPQFSYNFVEQDGGGRAPGGEFEITAMPPVYVGGPMFYLVATLGANLDLTARTRIDGCDQAALAAFLTGVHHTLTGPDAPG